MCGGNQAVLGILYLLYIFNRMRTKVTMMMMTTTMAATMAPEPEEKREPKVGRSTGQTQMSPQKPHGQRQEDPQKLADP